jgi:hypothetical protein
MDFPEPHRFGLWNNFSFRIYPGLSQVKGAITRGWADSYGMIKQELRIYEHDGERWQELFHLPKGSAKASCPLWDGVAPKTLAVSDADVNAAIASIIGE